MRKSLWIILTAVLVAICAPTARADSFTYSFVGTGYFAGTDVSFTTNGPAVLDSSYSPNTGATDLFVLGADKGPILTEECETSPFLFGTPTLQTSLLTALDTADGPTIAGTTIPGPGTYTEFFGHSTLTVTTPEPRASIPPLSGLGLLGLIFAMRKRSPVSQSPIS
jgi:hypothetical protein